MTERGVRRIAVFGAESTGKTRLVLKLAARFEEPWAPEFVRDYWIAKGGSITAADLGAIARGQRENEDAAALKADRLVFCDTELLTCTLWDDLLFAGHCPGWVREEAERRARNYAVYLLCDTDIPFVPDPQRSFPDPAGRAMCRQLWRDTLVSRGLPLVDIRGDWRAREDTAIAAVEQILARD